MITFELHETDGRPQLSINEWDENGNGNGFRIGGPKFDGTGEAVIIAAINALPMLLDVVEAAQLLVCPIGQGTTTFGQDLTALSTALSRLNGDAT